MQDPFRSTLMARPPRSAVFIPTNLPLEGDPRDVSDRAFARFKRGIEIARALREQVGRANVLVALFGGWPLHDRLPLAVHHAYAAVRIHKLIQIDELDFVLSYGMSTVTDLHGTLEWMKDNLLDVSDAYVVTSKGHAERLVTESDMGQLFSNVHHVETDEPRDDPDEDRRWTERARSIPAYQYLMSGRASDVTRFGSATSLEWAGKMGVWAEENPLVYDAYVDDLWNLLREFAENNVVVRSSTPGCLRININC